MIIGIGIDSVEIVRIEPWLKISQKKLLRIFSLEEITYALSNPNKSSERLAVRFAAREALYKALSPILIQPLPFLTLCSVCNVISSPLPELTIDFHQLRPFIQTRSSFFKSHLSLSHSKKNAIACVILERY